MPFANPILSKDIDPSIESFALISTWDNPFETFVLRLPTSHEIVKRDASPVALQKEAEKYCIEEFGKDHGFLVTYELYTY
jgi:hypothetical protein